MDKLWYKQPAGAWVEALPVGNGRLGGMIHGGTDREVISLNEDTLWSGYPRNLNPQGTGDVFRTVQALTMAGRIDEAQALVEEKLSSGWTQSYLPLGELVVEQPGCGDVADYERSLDLATGISSVRFHSGGVNYRREVFASFPDDILVCGLTADKPGSVNAVVSLTSQLRHSVFGQDGMLVLNGLAPSHVDPHYTDVTDAVVYSDLDEEKGMRFCAMVRPVCEGGAVRVENGALHIERADSVVLLLNARTSFNGHKRHPYLQGVEYTALCREGLNKNASKDYAELRDIHAADFGALYNRVSLTLGADSAASLPTDQRLRRFDGNDLSLYTLLFQYGRYLLLSSSRPGSQAANLQGIWNDNMRPPWSSNYTLNINTEMNYWPSWTCNLGELQEPLERLIGELYENGRRTARETYGLEGFVSHHNADLWRHTSPVGNHGKGTGVFSFWFGSAGWLCRHLFDRYEFTLDEDFLRKAYPILKEAAMFLLGTLVPDEAGRLVVSAATSPENQFLLGGKPCYLAKHATMYTAIIKELFGNCIECCELLDLDSEFAVRLKEALASLYPYEVGSQGQLLEWDAEYEEQDPHHRHVSHLYGLYPGHSISRFGTRTLADACRRSLELRGDEGTGWSLGWKLCLWARLGDGNRGQRLLNNQLRVVETDGVIMTGGGSYLNLFDAHPPFQIDGNFASSAGIAELLLQSERGSVHLLPALPDAWGTGSFRGLCAKGRITVSACWDGDELHGELLSEIEQTIQLRIGAGEAVSVTLTAGIPYIL